MRKWFGIFIVSVSTLGTFGCGLFSPQGTVHQQQYRASAHDPYGDNDLGPEIVGGRPQSFQKPRAEPERVQWFQGSWWSQDR